MSDEREIIRRPRGLPDHVILDTSKIGPETRAEIRAMKRKKISRTEMAKQLGIPKLLLNQVIIEMGLR